MAGTWNDWRRDNVKECEWRLGKEKESRNTKAEQKEREEKGHGRSSIDIAKLNSMERQ